MNILQLVGIIILQIIGVNDYIPVGENEQLNIPQLVGIIILQLVGMNILQLVRMNILQLAVSSAHSNQWSSNMVSYSELKLSYSATIVLRETAWCSLLFRVNYCAKYHMKVVECFYVQYWDFYWIVIEVKVKIKWISLTFLSVCNVTILLIYYWLSISTYIICYMGRNFSRSSPCDCFLRISASIPQKIQMRPNPM